MLSIGGGIGAGVTDALTKTVAALAGTHRLGVFGDVRLYLLIIVGLLTFTLQQNAFRAAGLSASLPSFAVLEPIVGPCLACPSTRSRWAAAASGLPSRCWLSRPLCGGSRGWPAR